jgi:hypothetical protein
VEYRHKDEVLRWAALFEPDAIDIFGTDEDFKAAGDARGVGPVVEKAIAIVDERRGPGVQSDPDDLSDQALSELIAALDEQARRECVTYGSFDHFVRATEDGPDRGAPLLGSAWVYELQNANPLGRNEPINSGCRTFGADLNKRICSVCLKGGLLLFQEPFCRTLAGQVPLLLTSAGPMVVNDLGVWNRLASSAYTWG